MVKKQPTNIQTDERKALISESNVKSNIIKQKSNS